MNPRIERAVSKVPEVTLVFWILKIAATTLGEIGGDAVTMSMNLGYLVGTAIFAMRSGPPTRIFAQAPEAASWLAEELDGAVEASRLAEACLQLRGVTG